MLRRLATFAALCLCAATLPAQTAVPSQPDGISYPTENSHPVSGVRIRTAPDGSVWFLVPSNDRIVHLQGATFTQWQLRDDTHLGLNPVDFEIDGSSIWFIGNGESLIDPGRSIFARLDTETGALREWVVPGSKPAGYWRDPAPDGKVWIPQTDGRLQTFDPSVVRVDPATGLPLVDKATGYLVGGLVSDYRSRSDDGSVFTFAYADVVQGPDGSCENPAPAQCLWMADFGNNRIVRYEPGADHETSWTVFNPNAGRLSLSQIRFDSGGRVWFSQLSNASISYLDLAENLLVNYSGFNFPIHFDIHQGRVYVAESPATPGGIAVLDPLLAFPTSLVVTPRTVPVRHVVNGKPALIRDSIITPTTFDSPTAILGSGDLTVTSGDTGSLSGTGILRTTFPSGRSWGILVADGYVWVGRDGGIVRVNLQDFGSDFDLCIPVALESAAGDPTKQDQDRVDMTLANLGGSTITGNILFLYSPAALAASLPFTIGPNGTNVQSDIFGSVLGPGFVVRGPVRIQVTGGNPGDLRAVARSAHSRASDGAVYGFTLPAALTSEGSGQGDQITLFTSGRDGDVTTLGLYTSSQASGSKFTATLVAADGTVRGTRSFDMPNNALEEYTPASSAFGVDPQPGDVVRVSAGPGSLRAFVRVADSGSGARAGGLPAHANWNDVAPYAVTGLGDDGTGPVTDLYLSNPDTGNPAAVTITLLANDPSTAPPPASLSVAPGGALVVPDVLQALFGLSGASGALKIVADRDIASAVRVASRKSDGDYATFLVSINGGFDALPAGGSAFASGLQEIPSVRSTDLLLSNGGDAATVTVAGYDGNGTEVSHLSVDLAAGQSKRIAAVLHALGLDGPGQIGNARVRVDAPGSSLVYAAFVQTDAVTGDPEIVLPR